MPQTRLARLAFNRGIADPLAGSRGDIDKLRLAAEISENVTPSSLGPMMLRAGWRYIDATYNHNVTRLLPFVRSASEKYLIELSAGKLRVRQDDVLVTRPAVTATITNEFFGTDLTGWTDADEGSAASTQSVSYMKLVGTGTARAIRYQTVTVNETGVEHAVTIVVEAGPVTLRIGSTVGGDEYIDETELGRGTHSIAFTPSGNFTIWFANSRLTAALINTCELEAAGDLELSTPWTANDLALLRYDQSADIMWVGSSRQQRKIERRNDRSWSIVFYEPEDGPFRNINTGPITISASGITGDVTLTASAALFNEGHEGALFRLESAGQLETVALSGADQFSDPIRVVGVGGQRAFSILVTGTFTATITLQQSLGEPGSWVDVETFTTAIAVSYTDELDNQEIYYRIGIKTGDYSSGSASATLVHTAGSTLGVVRITDAVSPTNVTAAVLNTLGAAGVATADWYEGAWSSYRGFPNVPRLYEGRLWHWGQEKVYGSVSDQYESFDPDVEGESGVIGRSIGAGPIERVTWVAPLARMVVGTASMSADVDCGLIMGDAPLEARSDSYDTPLTPTNFNMKRPATRAVYVDRSGIKLFAIDMDGERMLYDTQDLSILVPHLNAAGITVLGVQHRPDVRIHCIRADGGVGMLVFNKAENVICWAEMFTRGAVENVGVLPGDVEDDVYYVVKRTIGGVTKRYIEKWAHEADCVGGALNLQADSFVTAGSTVAVTAVAITGGSGAHTVTVTFAADHGLAAGDKCWLEDVVASGDFDVNGQQEVLAVPSSTSITLVIEDWEGFANGAYVSGGVMGTAAISSLSGLDHLEGETVVAWADGQAIGEFTVSSGAIALGASYSRVVAGLPYRGRWKSTRNAFAAGVGVAIGETKKLDSVALVLLNTHASGVRYGQDFDHLMDLPQNDLPRIGSPSQPDADHVYVDYETDPLITDGEWRTDSPLCLEMYAPKPACVAAALIRMSVNG